MSSRTSVDVLIPSLDRPDELRRALESLDAVARAEPEIDIRPQVIDRERGAAAGPAAARNLAAAQGHAEFIAFLDDDDQWLAPRLGRAIEVLRSRPDVALVCGDARLASGGRFLGIRPETDGDRDHAALALDCFVCSSTVTLRRADFEALGGMAEDLRRAEDYALWLQLTAGGRCIHLLAEPLAVYEDRGERLSSEPVAMAGATLLALKRAAVMPPGDRRWQDRVGRLEAVVSHGLSKEGSFGEARSLALKALAGSPRSRVAWTSVLRASLRIRR
jgi:hypothetical protein